MTNISILDCTLRDGGYINDWSFSKDIISEILNKLFISDVDFIECGFLDNTVQNTNKSLFSSIQNINKVIPGNVDKNKIGAMISFGKYPIENIVDYNSNYISFLRLIFKKSQMEPALIYAEKLINKGYKVFINPTFIDEYSFNDIENLIEKINKIQPYGFSIVDSTGAFDNDSLIKYAQITNKNLDDNISLCFHSHNNLKLSFSNSITLLEQNFKRNIIIDSSLLGIGRGAGNLPTEIIADYMNKKYNKKYNTSHMFELIMKYIVKIFIANPWGVSQQYYMSAINHCHPNYAKYLIENKIFSSDIINKILSEIKNNDKSNYNQNLIKKICESYNKE